MGPKMFKILCLLIICALFLVNCSTSSTSSTPTTVKALANKAIDGPFADGVSRILGPVVLADGGQTLSGSELVLIDGDYNTPEEMDEDVSLFQTALSTGKPVLLVDAKHTHKLSTLLSILGISGQGDTMALFIYKPSGGAEGGWIYEFTPGVTTDVLASAVDLYLNHIREFLTGNCRTIPTMQNVVPVSQSKRLLAEESGNDCASNPAQSKCMPEGLKTYKLATYSVLYDHGAGDGNLLDPFTLSIGIYDVFPDWGKHDRFITWKEWESRPFKSTMKPQIPSVIINHEVTLFADTKEDKTFKYVHIETSAKYSPGTFEDGKIANDDWDNGGRYWSQGAIQLAFDLTDKGGGKQGIAWKASSPQTRNNETTITDTMSFTIGFTAGGHGGKGKDGGEGGGSAEISAEWSFKHSEERAIADWYMTATSEGPLQNSWNYYQELPWNAYKDSWVTDCNTAKELPALSKGENQIHTQVLYQVEREAMNNTLTLTERSTVSYYRIARWAGWITPTTTKIVDSNVFHFDIDLSKLDTKDFYSPAFVDEGVIPAKYLGADPDFGSISPEFKWRDVPAEAKSLALIVEENMDGQPGAAQYMIFNMPPGINGTGRIPEGASGTDFGAGTIQGIQWQMPTTKGKNYTMKLYALDSIVNGLVLSNDTDADKVKKLRQAMGGSKKKGGHILEGYPLVWNGRVP